MKTLIIDAACEKGAYTVREFANPYSPVERFEDVGEAYAFASIWSNENFANHEPCCVIFINPKGEAQQLEYARSVTVSLNGCPLTTAQVEHLAEEFFGRIHAGAAHFSEKKYADAFAETLEALRHQRLYRPLPNE
jgi:hypothetical protein